MRCVYLIALGSIPESCLCELYGIAHYAINEGDLPLTDFPLHNLPSDLGCGLHMCVSKAVWCEEDCPEDYYLTLLSDVETVSEVWAFGYMRDMSQRPALNALSLVCCGERIPYHIVML